MVQVSYPGVYIVEKPSGVRTITGVATSIAAFVGFTRKGVPDRPETITSFADFERLYGGLDRDSPVSYAVLQFFANGGTQAIIVRVAVGHATATWPLSDSVPAPVLDISASSPGTWGNDLRITIQTAAPNVRNPDSEFNIVVRQLQPDGVTFADFETHRNLSMDPLSSRYVESVVNNASAAIRAKRRGGLTFTNAGFAVSGLPVPAFPLAPSDTIISGTVNEGVSGSRSFSLTLAGSPYANMAALVTAATNAINAAPGLAALLAAAQTGPDGSAGAGHLQLRSLTAGESSSVVIAGGAFGGLAASIKLGLANGGREFTGAAQRRPAAVISVAPGTAGIDGSRGTATDLAGSESAKTGIHALRDVDLFNLLLIPEVFDMTTPGPEVGLIAAAIALCEERRAFYLIDAPSNRTLSNIGAWASGATMSRNAATYFPPVRIADPLDGLRPRNMAPSGTLAGVYARTDAQRGVWKAPAGTEATLNGVIDIAMPVNDRENGQLNPLGVNVLRSFPAYGRVAWGARTRRGADAQADEYKYIPIRRLALFLEESLYRGTQWVVFEPNDEPLWAQIRLNLGAFMNGLFRQGAFQGTTPAEAYFVKCDKETTTQADRNLGIVNILVGFAPLKPAEFVVIAIQQIAGDL